jgi:VWFA-related protein
MRPTILFLLALALLGQTPVQTPPPGTSPPSTSPAQTAAPQPPQTPPANPNAPEMATHDEATAFKSRVNLVMVPVVIRDVQGRAVGNFAKEDFHLFDKGKPQDITKFSIEKAGELTVPEDDSAASSAAAAQKKAAMAIPERFVAYVFDDQHLSPEDLSRTRDAAGRQMANLRLSDRAAVYTMSGNVALDFTNQTSELYGALGRIRPAVMNRVGAMSNAELRDLATFAVLKQLVKRMTIAPGQRSIMLISPGFNSLAPELRQDLTDVLDRAIRANVIINTLDARGLFTDPAFNASGRGGTLAGMIARADVLAELASGTGGSFYQNSNDYDEGFRRLAAAPEYVYLLGFSPQNLKSDGSFHALKVTLSKGSGNVTVQARRGYYAPKQSDDAAETARQEIEAALFSREEQQELPIQVQTQFFKASEAFANISVLVHFNLKTLKLRKAEGRNRDDVTIVSGLFDRNGNYLQGIKKVLELRLKDETIEKGLDRPITIRTNFDVKPGTYLLRFVVRDGEGQLMSATNRAVDIPL